VNTVKVMIAKAAQVTMMVAISHAEPDPPRPTKGAVTPPNAY
jgi:hypothetical protein